MQQIIEKRSALLNHFFNQSIDYSKEEILAKEYAALSFSPREEYIDVFETGYEDVLTPTEELDIDILYQMACEFKNWEKLKSKSVTDIK